MYLLRESAMWIYILFIYLFIICRGCLCGRENARQRLSERNAAKELSFANNWRDARNEDDGACGCARARARVRAKKGRNYRHASHYVKNVPPPAIARSFPRFVSASRFASPSDFADAIPFLSHSAIRPSPLPSFCSPRIRIRYSIGRACRGFN